MRWKIQDMKEWHRWFAWYPVKVGDTLYWLEYMERRWIVEKNLRLIDPYDFGEYEGGWIYRLQGT